MQGPAIKIPAELFALAETSAFSGDYDLPVLQVGPDAYRMQEPIAWTVEVSNTGGAFLVRGSARALACCACSRCLEDAHVELEGDVEGYYLISAEDEGAGRAGRLAEDDAEDEFDVLPASHVIDLGPSIRAALIMAAPPKPLCQPACKGLCPRCGANLNEGPCSCEPDADDAAFEEAKNPFSALKDVTFD